MHDTSVPMTASVVTKMLLSRKRVNGISVHARG